MSPMSFMVLKSIRKFALLLLFTVGCHKPALSTSKPAQEEDRGGNQVRPRFQLSPSGRECVRVQDVTPSNRCAELAPAAECALVLEADYKKALDDGADVSELRAREKVLGDYYLSNGPVEKAVEHYQQAMQRDLALHAPEADQDGRELAIAQLRMGEVANCLIHHNDETCVLPLSPKARHADQRGSRAAMATLEKLLSKNPGDATLRWLLNLAAMTVGEYPGGIGKPYRIPEAAFKSKETFPHFPNIAPALGLHRQNMVGGVVVDDFNGDGRLDLVLSSIGECDSLQLLLNNGHGGFSDKTAGSGLDRQLGVSQIFQADYDNDGLLDLYLMRGIWEKPGEKKVPVFNSLLRNMGGGLFEDVTGKVGLQNPPSSNIASVWADFDNDGWVDLLSCGAYQKPKLFLNEKGAHFREAGATGLVNDGNCMGVAAGDVDDDGLIDIFLSVHDGKSTLFMNHGGGVFKPAEAPIEGLPGNAFATWFFDYNNDGRLDLWVNAWDARAEDPVGKLMLGQSVPVEHAMVYQNLGGGRFKPVKAGLDGAILVMGANYGDFDNDGYEDVLLGTGGPPFEFLLPNRAYRNDRGKGFRDVTFAGGFGNLQKGHGIGFADLDNDGDQDIVASFGGWFAADRFAVSVYENPGFGNHWVTLRLQGTRANRSALGSRIELEITENGVRRRIYRVVNSGGSFGAGSLQAEIGLGRAVKIDLLKIVWAGSGTETKLTDLQSDHVYRILEGGQGADIVVQGVEPLDSAGTMGEHHNHSQ